MSVVKFCFLLVVFPFWTVTKSSVYWSVGDCGTVRHIQRRYGLAYQSKGNWCTLPRF